MSLYTFPWRPRDRVRVGVKAKGKVAIASEGSIWPVADEANLTVWVSCCWLPALIPLPPQFNLRSSPALSFPVICLPPTGPCPRPRQRRRRQRAPSVRSPSSPTACRHLIEAKPVDDHPILLPRSPSHLFLSGSTSSQLILQSSQAATLCLFLSSSSTVRRMHILA